MGIEEVMELSPGCSPWKVRSLRIKTGVVLEGVIVSQVPMGNDPGPIDDRNQER